MTKEELNVSLMDDFLFKESLSHKENRYMLEYLIKTLIGIDIKNYETNYESIIKKHNVFEKSMRSDILVKTKDTTINLECYSKFDEEALNKSVHYMMKLYSNLYRGK